MNSTEITGSAPARDLGAILRPRRRAVWARIGARRVLIALGLAAVGAGIVLNWGWLTAIGVAPVLVAAAPCAAMCALGLCLPRMLGGNSAAANQNFGNREPASFDTGGDGDA
jgi:hypothetical protein